MKVKFGRQDKLTWYGSGHAFVGVVVDICVVDGDVVYQMKCDGLYYDVEQEKLREVTGVTAANNAELLAELKHRNFGHVYDLEALRGVLVEDEKECLKRALDSMTCDRCGDDGCGGKQVCYEVVEKLREVGVL